ncbi:MAG: multicopper oxidase domain-containing protein [Candidatus Eremiobacter antarcticus]|nr:multicopper oxidase domain-containing protein [Candidatus Eremiobacteraeota bacterium]
MLLTTVGCSAPKSETTRGDLQVPPVSADVSTIAPGYRLPAPATQPDQLPPLRDGNKVHFDLVLLDRTVQIAPGIRYRAWTFNGSVPGPVLHVKVGDTVDISLTNKALMGHSIDFHAALAPPDVAYQTVQPGKTFHFSWVAQYPGAFLYHCGTAPVLAHISNGMYGAIIIDPPGGWGDAARQFVFVQSEFYPSRYPGSATDYYGDLQKMKSGMADVVTFNGMAFQYRTNPLPIKVGEKVRAFVVDAGPSHFSAFHVVGTVFSRVFTEGNPHNELVGIQTLNVPPGGGAVAEFTVQQEGIYPIVTHSFGDADNGAMGLFRATR